MSFDPKAAFLAAADADEAMVIFGPVVSYSQGGDRPTERRMVAAPYLKIDQRPSPAE
jgi:hypothetical protein